MNSGIKLFNLIFLFFTLKSSAQVLFSEQFDDTLFAQRGWYDNTTNVILSAIEHCPGSSSSVQYTWNTGQIVPSSGGAMRMLFSPSEEIYISYWVKYSNNYVGSGVAYHPHEVNILTNADNMWIGPAGTHLTAYIEHNGGHPRLALQDMLNVDTNCILQNNNNFVGCNGNFSTYPFTENRSVCSCNGLAGQVDGRDCFQSGSNPAQWYSARFWRANNSFLLDSSWHQLQVRFKMNSITGVIGQTDGIMQYWLDGQLILDYDSILYRTAANANMKFNQFLIGPYIGVGSPVTQSFWIDELVLSTLPIINVNINEYSNTLMNINLGQIPVSTDLEIIADNLKNATVKIKVRNMMGNIILENEISEGVTHIDVSYIRSGIYFLTIDGNNPIQARKFIIQH